MEVPTENLWTFGKVPKLAKYNQYYFHFGIIISAIASYCIHTGV